MKLPRLRVPRLPKFPAVTPELAVFAVGLAAFVGGLALVYLPAGLIGGGVVLMSVAVFGPGKEGAR